MWILEVLTMYNNVSREYKECMNAPLRNRMYIMVSLGVVNQDAQGNGTFSSDLAIWSNKNSPWNNRALDAEYATFEENFAKADGSMVFLPELDNYNPNVGIASNEIMGTIVVKFPYSYDIKGITLNFGEAYPTSFKVVTDSKEYTYSNDSQIFETTDNLGITKQISIIPLEMVGGAQRLRIKKILMGVGLNYTNAEIQNMNITEDINAISSEIPSINFDLTILDPDNVYNVDNDDSFINYLQTGQPVNVAIGLELDSGSTEYVQVAKLLLSNWQSKKNTMSFNAIDKFVLLDDDYEDNRIHTRTLYDDAEAILTFCGFEPDEYVIDDCLHDVTITNPLPRTSCKELLQLIANAGRCIVYQNREGLIVFKANFATVIDPEDVSVSTSSQADWSNPSNVMRGSEYVYADFTRNFASADGSMYFMPENGEGYLDTSFVSAEIANDNGEFEVTPSITLELQAGFTYYGLTVLFDGNPPQQMVINTSYLGEDVQEIVINEPDKRAYIPDGFKLFDKMVISFPVGVPKNRVLVNKITFGELTDYYMSYYNIIGDVLGRRETKTKNVLVKVYTYELDEDNEPVEVEDNVYYTQNINPQGANVTLENPLIGTMELAQDVAEWLGFYYSNNVSYTADYRGDPRLNASDLLYLESDVLNNLQVEIETHKLTFDGSLKGSLNLRRAIRMEGAGA